MENKSNRIFYKVPIDMQKEYPDKKKFIRFIMRIPDENIAQFRTIEGFEDLSTCKKSNKSNRDKVDVLNFDVMPYDNTKAKDYVANHAVCVSLPQYREEISTLIKEKFNWAKLTKSGINSITTQLYPSRPHGTWHTAGEEEKIKYPICILSYKRANKFGKSHLTLTKYKINHYLFIEPSQEAEYRGWYNPEYCELVIGSYDFSKDNMGSSVVRNYILDWASDKGYGRAWMLDDNIKGYRRYWQGQKDEIISHEIFSHIEKYIERYDNVGGVAHNFSPFIMEGDLRPCIVQNNKVYSSMLLKTGPDIRFRYKHQEDNLISMEYITKGYSNLCFNSILYDKDTSGKDGGGNKEAIYKVKKGRSDGDGYKERFEYFEAIAFVLFCEKKLKLVEGASTKDLIKRSKTMKSKEWHANCCYEYLAGKNNKIYKKENYDEIVKNQIKSNLKCISKPTK